MRSLPFKQLPKYRARWLSGAYRESAVQRRGRGLAMVLAVFLVPSYFAIRQGCFNKWLCIVVFGAVQTMAQAWGWW